MRSTCPCWLVRWSSTSLNVPVCRSVCPLPCLVNHTSKPVHMAVARSSFDDSAIRYVLPVLWMTSCFHIMTQIQTQDVTRLNCASRAKFAVVDCLAISVVIILIGVGLLRSLELRNWQIKVIDQSSRGHKREKFTGRKKTSQVATLRGESRKMNARSAEKQTTANK